MSINRVAISGNLGGEPELRMTAGGTPVLSFRIAVNERVKNRSGEWEDRANWVDCTMFGKRAEALRKYLSKGSKVALEGRLRYSRWERDGVAHSKLEVVVDELDLMSWDGSVSRSAAPEAPDVYDEDIPF